MAAGFAFGRLYDFALLVRSEIVRHALGTLPVGFFADSMFEAAAQYDRKNYDGAALHMAMGAGGLLAYNGGYKSSAKGAGSKLSGYGAKSESYLTKRGWTWDSAQDVVGNPYTTREAVNKATKNSATVFYNKAGDYVVRDNITGELVQTSKFGDVNWIPDSSIVNPYRP